LPQRAIAFAADGSPRTPLIDGGRNAIIHFLGKPLPWAHKAFRTDAPATAKIQTAKCHQVIAPGAAQLERPSGVWPSRLRIGQRNRLAQPCRSAGLKEPEMLAGELYLLLEGARVTAQGVGREDLGARLTRMSEAMIAAHKTP
jgi:hypothetical protein